MQTEPDATAVQALVQACGTCHNDVLDQTVSRARFNVAVGRLDRTELATAIERLDAFLEHAAHVGMVPARIR